MGKVDDLRALREARYASMQRGDKFVRKLLQLKPLEDRENEVAVKSDAVLEGITLICGHRAISGKTCTRPKDHSEKNHRYK